jgi:hypothetical protein
MNKMLVSAEWHFFATSHRKGPADGIGGTVKRLAEKTSLQKVYINQIHIPHELTITAAATYIMWHSFKSKNKFLTFRSNLQIDLTSHLQIREFNLIIISCH